MFNGHNIVYVFDIEIVIVMVIITGHDHEHCTSCVILFTIIPFLEGKIFQDAF